MKKLFILLTLFLIVVVVSVGVVINEQKRKTTVPVPVQNGGETVSESAPSVKEQATTSTAAPSTEGDITLAVTSPQNNFSTNDSSITVAGKTTPGASVMINEYELKAGSDGSFSQNVTLDDGENYFSIVAYTAAGAVAEQEIVVVKNVSNY